MSERQYISAGKLFWIINIFGPLVICFPIWIFLSFPTVIRWFENGISVYQMLQSSLYLSSLVTLGAVCVGGYLFGGVGALFAALLVAEHYNRKGCIRFVTLLLYGFIGGFLGAFLTNIVIKGSLPPLWDKLLPFSLIMGGCGVLSAILLYFIYLRKRLRPCAVL